MRSRSLVGKCYRKSDLTMLCLRREVEPDDWRNANLLRVIPRCVDAQERITDKNAETVGTAGSTKVCHELHSSIAASFLRRWHRFRMRRSQRLGIAATYPHRSDCGSRNRLIRRGICHARYYGQLRSPVPNVDVTQTLLGPRNGREGDKRAQAGDQMAREALASNETEMSHRWRRRAR